MSRLLSASELRGGGGSRALALPLLHCRSALSTVSFAHGSGGTSEGPAEAITPAEETDGGALGPGGEILTVTGLHTARGCRRDQMVRLR